MRDLDELDGLDFARAAELLVATIDSPHAADQTAADVLDDALLAGRGHQMLFALELTGARQAVGAGLGSVFADLTAHQLDQAVCPDVSDQDVARARQGLVDAVGGDDAGHVAFLSQTLADAVHDDRVEGFAVATARLILLGLPHLREGRAHFEAYAASKRSED